MNRETKISLFIQLGKDLWGMDFEFHFMDYDPLNRKLVKIDIDEKAIEKYLVEQAIKRNPKDDLLDNICLN